jgi:hypothetical protein
LLLCPRKPASHKIVLDQPLTSWPFFKYSDTSTVTVYALNRMALTALGILMWLFCSNFLWPDRATESMRRQVASFLAAWYLTHIHNSHLLFSRWFQLNFHYHSREWHEKTQGGLDRAKIEITGSIKRLFDNPNGQNSDNQNSNHNNDKVLNVPRGQSFIALSSLSAGVSPSVILIEGADLHTTAATLAVNPLHPQEIPVHSLNASPSKMRIGSENHNHIRFVTNDPLPPPPPPPLAPSPPLAVIPSLATISSHDSIAIHINNESKGALLSKPSSLTLPTSSSALSSSSPSLLLPHVYGPFALSASSKALASMKASLGSQQLLIDAAAAEPDHRRTPFPVATYRKIMRSEEILIMALTDMDRSLRRVISGKRESVAHRQIIRYIVVISHPYCCATYFVISVVMVMLSKKKKDHVHVYWQPNKSR